MLRERWPPWKAGLYGSEVASLRGCSFSDRWTCIGQGVISQEQEGKWKPIAFLSRTMQPVEQNYKIYDKELLVIVEALAKWRQYLLDAAEIFEIWMDHKNLKYFWEPYKLNR